MILDVGMFNDMIDTTLITQNQILICRVISEKIIYFIFWPSFSILNPLCPGMLDLRIWTANGQF